MHLLFTQKWDILCVWNSIKYLPKTGITGFLKHVVPRRIQLTEFIIQDNLQLWMKNGDLGNSMSISIFISTWLLIFLTLKQKPFQRLTNPVLNLTESSLSSSDQFDEWVRSILQARQALEALEHRSGSYLIYLERVIGVTAKQAGQHSHLLTTLLCS